MVLHLQTRSTPSSRRIFVDGVSGGSGYSGITQLQQVTYTVWNFMVD